MSLHVIQSRAEFEAWRQATTTTISFVPTMGALHKGHLALFEEAKKYGQTVVVSIFVNPTQFNDPKDFEKYPRTLEEDLKKCAAVGVDVVFAPTAEDMYPAHETPKRIPLPEVAKPLEGQSRPGHFQGVITIVSKLFEIVKPQYALFGLKDFQQVRVIQEMVKSQNFPITIIACPIVRSPEGLALSSRNTRLSPAGLKKALGISQTLTLAQQLFQQGLHDPKTLVQKLTDFVSEDPDLKIDSIDIVDAQTLLPPTSKGSWLVALAVFVEGVRLIDNCVLK